MNVKINEEFEIEIPRGLPFFTWGGGSWARVGVTTPFHPQDVHFHHRDPTSSLLLPAPIPATVPPGRCAAYGEWGPEG